MNDKLIMKDGKPHKIAEVVMLPTKEQRWKVGNQHDDRYESYSFVDKKLYSRQSNAHNWSLSHLYILSSKEIKEGDWYMYCHFGEWIISNSRETLKKGTNTLENLNKDDYFKKIIATTDRSLKIERNFTDQQGYFEYLPRPSDDFIKVFVKTQGKITKLLVEYIDWCDYDDDNEVGLDKPDLRLKVAPDNTITIKPIQEEKAFWSRKEVIKLCMDAMLYSYMDLPENLTPIQGMNKWIEENL